MSRFDTIAGRVIEIAGDLGDRLKDRVPDRALQWIETGAALGVLKSSGRIATRIARRNPAVAAATAAVTVAGVLVYLVRRHQNKTANGGAIEGKATRIEARPGTRRPAAKRARKTTAS
ncbi:MAG: hypothetical protein ACREO8_02490 [Luteimonas sp.]